VIAESVPVEIYRVKGSFGYAGVDSTRLVYNLIEQSLLRGQLTTVCNCHMNGCGDVNRSDCENTFGVVLYKL